MQYAQPNERATGWEYLESKINTEGRQKILNKQYLHYRWAFAALFVIHATNIVLFRSKKNRKYAVE